MRDLKNNVDVKINEFETMKLSMDVLEKLNKKNFLEPTEIQKKVIPVAIEGKDIIAVSATGTGKTLAFGLPLVEKVEARKKVQALILTPTRELAEQVSSVLKEFGRVKGLNVAKVYGGVAINPQISKLKTAEIVVGTPGRILDHLQRGTLRLDKIKVFVLDEADRMLDMGFIDDIGRIVRELPAERQTLFFSATMPEEIKKIAKRFTKEAVKIKAKLFVDPKKLSQVYFDVEEHLKLSLLVHLLRKNKALSMVFCNSRKTVDFVVKTLNTEGIKAMGLHGGLSQPKRSFALEQFHKGIKTVLVCTDVAARGLDIKGVSFVYNYDIPKDSKQYVHRIGRTARAGLDGKAINLLSRRDYENYERVLRFHSLDIPKEKTPFVKKIKTFFGRKTIRRNNFRKNRAHY